MTDLEIIRRNAETVVRQVGPLSNLGEEFGYNRASLEWLEGYIERLRASDQFKGKQAIENLTSVFGSFLGECVVRAFEGEWRNEDHKWGVYFSNGCAAFPYAKVAKQFENGLDSGDSIVGFFDMIPEVFGQKVRS